MVGVEVDGVMQLDICSGALEDRFKRSQAGGRQLAILGLQVRECGLNQGRSGMRGDRLDHRPA